MNVFATMSQIDIRKITERKNGFTYLSWAHAYRLLMTHCPQAEVIKHTFHADSNGNKILPYMSDAEGYAYVQVTVKIDEHRTSEIMPVLNHANRPIKNPNSFEVNAQIQRCMAKAISMATGLGIHLYAGEDMPAPVPAGPDNSGSKAERGEGADKMMTVAHKTESEASAPSQPLKQISPMSIAQKVTMAPDMDSLMRLYREEEASLSSEDRLLFTARRKELQFNG